MRRACLLLPLLVALAAGSPLAPTRLRTKEMPHTVTSLLAVDPADANLKFTWVRLRALLMLSPLHFLSHHKFCGLPSRASLPSSRAPRLWLSRFGIWPENLRFPSCCASRTLLSHMHSCLSCLLTPSQQPRLSIFGGLFVLFETVSRVFRAILVCQRPSSVIFCTLNDGLHTKERFCSALKAHTGRIIALK